MSEGDVDWARAGGRAEVGCVDGEGFVAGLAADGEERRGWGDGRPGLGGAGSAAGAAAVKGFFGACYGYGARVCEDEGVDFKADFGGEVGEEVEGC